MNKLGITLKKLRHSPVKSPFSVAVEIGYQTINEFESQFNSQPLFDLSEGKGQKRENLFLHRKHNAGKDLGFGGWLNLGKVLAP